MNELFKIGHYTDKKKGTGCSVIICPNGTKASAHARGVSPGTREYALLSPFRKVEEVNALFLTGGSAFGLDSAAGVMQFLDENNVGFKTRYRNIPIVPAAVIYDLPVIDSNVYPLPGNAYNACQKAIIANNVQGNIGAGTGATVGKWAGLEYMMKGGLGLASFNSNDLWIDALSVVNSVGDVIDNTGKIIAGARDENHYLADVRLDYKMTKPDVLFGNSTVLIAIMTNANLTKLQLNYLAERAHNGIVKAIKPAHTSYDGDIVFTLGLNQVEVDIDYITEITIELVRQSVLNAILSAKSLGGIVSFTDIKIGKSS
jgi:L-aminopeptidase/D-esterase-like protein